MSSVFLTRVRKVTGDFKSYDKNGVLRQVSEIVQKVDTDGNIVQEIHRYEDGSENVQYSWLFNCNIEGNQRERMMSCSPIIFL